MEKSITVPLKLTKSDIRSLANELNECPSSLLTDFISATLRMAERTSRELEQTARETLEANPYSQQYKESKEEHT